MTDPLFDDDSRLLKPHAFEFVLDGELRRAVRSQNYLTLVTVETSREFDGMTVAADQGTVGEVAHIIRRGPRHRRPGPDEPGTALARPARCRLREFDAGH